MLVMYPDFVNGRNLQFCWHFLQLQMLRLKIETSSTGSIVLKVILVLTVTSS